MRAAQRRPYSTIELGRLAELVTLGRELLRGDRLIVASNRGPLQYGISPDGSLEEQRGAGGVVTALSALHRYLRLTWVASALTEGDRKVAAQSAGHEVIPVSVEEGSLEARFVSVPPRVFQCYYNTFANPLLWFLQHYMWDPSLQPDIDRRVHRAWDGGYVPVNRAFADALVAETRRPDASRFIMLHDYHLYLVAGMIRSQLPDIISQHFVHIPWPDPEYWHLLPARIRQAIFEGLCANDIVGLQTRRSALNFLNGCQT